MNTPLNSKVIVRMTLALCLLFLVQLQFTASASGDNSKLGVNHTAWLSLLNKDIGTIGTLADRNPVLQVYVNTILDNRYYASIWANIPLDPHNRSQSTEFDFSVGYVQQFNGYRLDYSVALFDLENPSIGDLDNDILTTRFRVDKGNKYFEVSHYEGINARDGWLAAMGYKFNLSENVSLSSNLSYTSGPFNFDRIAFIHSKLSYQRRKSSITYFAEFIDQVYRENPLDPRRSTLLFGIKSNFL